MIVDRERPIEAGFNWKTFHWRGQDFPNRFLRPFSTTIPRRHDRAILEAVK